jgi:hypothetical protein
VTAVRTTAAAALLAAAILGIAGCGHGTSATPAPSPATAQQMPSELSSIQATLDNIDKDLSEDSP